VLSVGDEAFQRKCLDRIDEIQASGKTIVFVTHNVEITKEICTRVVMLESGNIVKQGNPREVVAYYHQSMESTQEGQERGNKQIRVTGVGFLDDKGEVSTSFHTGQQMRIRVHYKATVPVEDPVFGFSIEDYRGFTAFGTNTKLKGVKLGTLDGEGIVEFDLQALPMLEGKYFVSLAIHSQDEQLVYHWLDKHVAFDIASDTSDIGLLYIPCNVNVFPGGK
jgi:lipopolysaccharide transport system ATP-binding protein